MSDVYDVSRGIFCWHDSDFKTSFDSSRISLKPDHWYIHRYSIPLSSIVLHDFRGLMSSKSTSAHDKNMISIPTTIADYVEEGSFSSFISIAMSLKKVHLTPTLNKCVWNWFSGRILFSQYKIQQFFEAIQIIQRWSVQTKRVQTRSDLEKAARILFFPIWDSAFF